MEQDAEIAQMVNLSYKPKSLSLRTYIKKLGVMVGAYLPTGCTETAGSLGGSLACQLNQLSKFQARERPCLNNQNGQYLRNDS